MKALILFIFISTAAAAQDNEIVLRNLYFSTNDVSLSTRNSPLARRQYKGEILVQSMRDNFDYYFYEPNYADSVIQLQLTQKMAYWIGHSIMVKPDWANRTAPDVLRAYIGNGHKPDSLFVGNFKARYIMDGLETLLQARTSLGKDDYRSIVLNQPSILGYTGLGAQIVAKANQGDPVGIFLRDWFNARLADFQSLYDANKQSVVDWSNN